MSRLAPQFWVVLLYHFICVIGVLVNVNDYWELDGAVIKAIVVLGGSITISAYILAGRKVPLLIAIPIYLALAIIILSADVYWGNYSLFHFNFANTGDRFSFSAGLRVVIAQTSYNDMGFVMGSKGLDLVPLAICLLTQMRSKTPDPIVETNDHLLDDEFS